MKTARKGSPSNKFKSAVESIPEVADGYRPGLQALESNASKIKVRDTRLLSGSIDIDKCTKNNYPEENRWDYAVGYNDKAYFIEIHGASSPGEVKTIISKAEWLKSWLRKTGKPLLEIQASNTLYWIATGKVTILQASKYRKQLATKNINLVGGVLDINKVFK